MTNKLNNNIYPEQYLLLAFISIITFKVVMLAQYLVSSAGNEAYITMAIMIAIELMMTAIVYAIIKNGSLLEQDLPKALKGIFAIILLFTSFAKCTLLGSEGVSYISTTIYDNVRWSYVTLALLLACTYLAYKGGKVIARTAQIFFWLFAISFAFHVVFSNTQLEIVNLMPFDFSSKIAVAGDKYLIWFGDYTALMFFSISKSPNATGKKLIIWTIIAIAGTILCAVGLMIIFICIFGESGAIIGNAFLNVSSLNKIAFMIGSMDLPTVCSWIVMCIIKISLLIFAAKECLKFFFGDKWWISVICGLVTYFVIVYGIGNLKTSYSLATSVLRYFVYFADFAVVVITYTIVFIRNKNKKSSQKSAMPKPHAPALEENSKEGNL